MNSLKKFHKDERGMEALQVIMIVAIAAVLLALLKFAWPFIKTWFKENVANILGISDATENADDKGGATKGNDLGTGN